MLEIEVDDSKLRKKRPERQLYVPPAQRRSIFNEPNNIKTKPKVKNYSSNKYEKVTEEITNHGENQIKCEEERKKSQEPIERAPTNIPIFEFLLCTYFIQSRWNFVITGSQLKFHTDYEFNFYQNKNVTIDNLMLQIPVILFYSDKGSYSYQEKLYENYFYMKSFPYYITKTDFQYTHFKKSAGKISVIVTDFHNTSSNLLKHFYIFCDYDKYSIDNILFIDNSFKLFPYFQIILDGTMLDKQTNNIFDKNDNISNNLNSSLNLFNKDDASASENLPLNENQALFPVNISNQQSLRKKKLLEKTDHEEEVEIMRKTKEHINRKTRPIMKYVGEANDTLNINDDSVKSWEDLFDEEGELKEELLSVDKLEQSKPNMKSKQYSDEYIEEDIKHIEELEHMVELYNFPSTFKTHDLIQAFSSIDCEAMYIKWVDDTHAILVLGTLTQATKAANLNNPLIKVRPMAAASQVSLAIAYKNDLKPAMKRPPTNLQAARRFITAALGTKIGVSKEKMAKEREDLKVAREMKKKIRKNEKDAWEGNLQSSLH